MRSGGASRPSDNATFTGTGTGIGIGIGIGIETSHALQRHVAWFHELDAWTEYWVVYHPEDERAPTMRPMRRRTASCIHWACAGHRTSLQHVRRSMRCFASTSGATMSEQAAWFAPAHLSAEGSP